MATQMKYSPFEDMGIDCDEVERLIAERYIRRERHWSASLWIYNYTQKAQFDNVWTPETKACRGLILSETKIVARPFQKFFNIEQHETLPNEPFDVYEKMDGSLGVLYFGWEHDPDPYIATRGSFVSQQATEATKILREKYSHVRFDPSLTYLFEILYPANRIVVDYGDRRDLVLLAVIDTATGRELRDIDQLECVVYGKIPVVECVPGRNGVDGLTYLRAKEEPNKEGFVIRFESGLRVKLKFADYKRLHKLLTGINERHLWEAMRAGKFEELLERVPDEFYQWARAVESEVSGRFVSIEERCKAEFRDLGDRKTTAEYFKTCAYPSILFSMLDRRPYADAVWKLVKPETTRSFKIESEVSA